MLHVPSERHGAFHRAETAALKFLFVIGVLLVVQAPPRHDVGTIRKTVNTRISNGLYTNLKEYCA